jgi:hypothetical protein
MRAAAGTEFRMEIVQVAGRERAWALRDAQVVPLERVRKLRPRNLYQHLVAGTAHKGVRVW